MSVIFSQCLDCKHYFFDIKDKHCCKAFPKGIGDEVFLSKISHENHIPSDNGYKFTPLWEEKIKNSKSTS